MEVSLAAKANWGWFQWQFAQLGVAVEEPYAVSLNSLAGVALSDFYLRLGLEGLFAPMSSAFAARAGLGYTWWLGDNWTVEFDAHTRLYFGHGTLYGFGAGVGYVF